MGHSKTYKLFVFSFLLLFSFFHVGYATVEYICSMGMEMETSVCSSCHPEPEPLNSKVVISATSGSSCCKTVVTEKGRFDSYISNSFKPPIDNTHNLTPIGIILNPEENPVTFPGANDAPMIPHYNLHGISTSVQYSSSLQ